MIHYRYKTNGSGLIQEGWADRIRVCYLPDAVKVKVLEGTNETELLLSRDWNEDAICEFACDKFSLKA